MRSLRLKNFRSLVDTGPIELRPLTVLVGANSSGKSSFLRFFPLLRQTYEARSASPLLWYGRDVDFGDFSQVVRREAAPKVMGVEWEQDLDPPEAKHWLMHLPWKSRLRVQSSSRLTDLNGSTQTSSYAFGWDGMVLRLDTDGSAGPAKLSATSPSEFWFSLPNVDAANALVPILEAKSTYEWRPPRLFPCVSSLKSFLGEILRGKVTSETIDELVDDLPIVAEDKWLDAVSELHGGRALAKVLRSEKSGYNLSVVRLYTLASLLPVILETLRESLARFAARVVYLRPVRAEPRRFYRVQELSVAHMDPHGENLAMFLRSLPPDQLDAFSEFAFEHIGHRVRLRSEGMNVAILLVDDMGGSFNLTDMGYGFAQVLPIVAQCWATSTGRRLTERDPLPGVVAIEQPELHLHPHYQAKLADMFVGSVYAARAAVPDTRFIIETHSEALVSRLGELVELGKVSSKDVSVLLFEQDPVTKDTTVRQSTFSPDGILQNWPVGFFAP